MDDFAGIYLIGLAMGLLLERFRLYIGARQPWILFDLFVLSGGIGWLAHA